MEEGRPSVIPFGMYRTRMRIRSRTLVNTANGQADVPLQATLIDLVGHVRPATNIREDAIVNYSEGAIDTIDIVIPYYEGILTGFLVEVYDSINSATAVTYYEILSIADDRNKHQQLSLRCKVAERSILPAPSYAATLVTVGGGGGGGGSFNQTTTNLVLHSEGFITGWGVAASIAITSSGTAPDNVGTGKVATVTAGSFASINQSIGSGTNRTLSLFVKAGTSSSLGFGALSFATTWGNNADSTGTIISGPGTITQSNGGLFLVSGLSSSAWTRIAVTRTSQHDALYIYPVGVGSGLTGSIGIWGAQAEANITARSYVPTTTTSAVGYTPGGGGGGAGEYKSTAQTLQVATSYAVIIGSGGAGAITGSQQAADGTTSSFIGGTISQTSTGGGGGGSGLSLAYPAQGGGSGGGAGGIVGGTGGVAAAGGNQGGNAGAPASPWRGGGGGGGGSAGVIGNAGSGTGGNGISGFAGGGGGGSSNASGGPANGGGGAGGNSTATGGNNGTANTGGGGGGAGNNTSNSGTSTAGGNGGSGVVTVQYAGNPIATYTGTMTTVTVAGVTTHTLQTSGTFTA